MFRNISFVFLASTLFFSVNIKALDQDIFNKAKGLLEQKKIKRELKEKIDPIKYTQKKEKYAQKNTITAQQYLETKHRELLAQYERLNAIVAMDSALSVITGVADGIVLLVVALSNTWHLNEDQFLLAGAFFGNIVIFGIYYMEIERAQAKTEALLEILDKKIQKIKQQNNRDKEILEAA